MSIEDPVMQCMPGGRVPVLVPAHLISDVVDALVAHAYVLAKCGADLEVDGPAKQEFGQRSLGLTNLHRELSALALAAHGKAY